MASYKAVKPGTITRLLPNTSVRTGVGASSTTNYVSQLQQTASTSSVKTTKVNGKYVADAPYTHSNTVVRTNRGFLTVKGGIPLGSFVDTQTGSFAYVTGNYAVPAVHNWKSATDRDFPDTGSILASRIKSQSIDLSLTFAEFGKTAALIGNTARRIASAVSALRRGRIDEVFHFLGGGARTVRRRDPGEWTRVYYRKRSEGAIPFRDFLANSWMEAAFGWRPLLGDVYGAAEQLAQLPLDDRLVKQRTRKDSQRTWSASTTALWSISSVQQLNCSRSMGISYKVDSPSLALLKQVGLTNPLATVHDLVPYSFVLDWWLPVGTWLRNQDYDLGLTFVRGFDYKKTAMTRQLVASRATASARGTAVLIEQRVVKARSTLGGFPSVPLPTGRFNAESLFQPISALAIMQQQLRAIAPGTNRRLYRI